MGQIEIKQLEQKRQQLIRERKNRKKLPILLTLILIIIIIVLFIVGYRLIAFYSSSLLIIPIKWWLNSGKNKKSIKSEIMNELSKEMNLNLKYDVDDIKDEFLDKIMNSDFWGLRNPRIHTEDIIAVNFDDIPLVMGNVEVTKDMGQNSYTKIFIGPIGYIQINKKLPQVTLLPDKLEKYFGGVGKLMNKLSMRQIYQENIYFNEDPDFEKNFVVWTEDEEYARKLLTPQFRNFLSNIISRNFSYITNRNIIYLTINEDYIILGLDLRMFILNFDMEDPITQSRLDSMKNDFILFSGLLKEIKNYVINQKSSNKIIR